MKDITLLTQLQNIDPARGLQKNTPTTSQNFTSMLSDAIDKTNQALTLADSKTRELQQGKGSLHDVMIVSEQADISMRMLLQMRNKMVEAYKEIMRLQI